MSRKLTFSVDDESNDVVKRFEQFMSGSATGYFDVEELETIVEYYLRRGRTKDCTKALELGLQLHPNSTALKTKRAKIYLAIGDTPKAFRILNKLSESNDYEVILLKTEALIKLDRRKEARLLCEQLLREESDDLDNVCLDIAYIYLAQIDFETSIEYLEKGDKFNNQNIDLLFELAFCYEQIFENDKAIATYNRIIDVEPYLAEAWFNLGQVYFSMQDFVKAIEAYDFALTIDEKDSLTCLQKAHAHFQLNQFELAIENYLDYGKKSTDLWETDLFIAECYEKMELYDKSISYYKKSIEAHPQNYDAFTGIAICLLEQEKYSESIVYVNQALAIQNEASDAWVYLAEAMIGLDDIDKALEAYLKSIDLDFNQPDTLMAIANIYLEKGEYENALIYYNSAQKMDSSLEYIDLFIAVAHFKTGNYIESMLFLRKAISIYENAATLFLELCPEAVDTLKLDN